jgi:meiotic recombination protein SPO11
MASQVKKLSLSSCQAKGYPDIATRALLHFLTTPLPRNNMLTCPTYALMDFDPDGINILSTYKHGSIALSHENDHLAVDTISWLGISSKDLREEGNIIQTQGLLKLSSRDRRKASRMLELDPFTEDGREPEWRREIQVMLMLNVKAEIQLLEAQDGGLHTWLAGQLP